MTTTYKTLKAQFDADYAAHIAAGGNPVDFYLERSQGVPSEAPGDDADDGDGPPQHGDDAGTISINAMFDEIAARATTE